MKSLIVVILCIAGFSYASLSQVFLHSQKITASDRSSGATFASGISISGDYAIAGAQGETEDENGNNTLSYSGAAYIYERSQNGHWQQKQKLVASDRAASDYFGGDVSISGNTAVVGAYDKNALGTNTYTHAGAVYIFERDNNGTWNEVKKIVAADTGSGDHFGYKVAVSGDYIIIGSPIDAEDPNGNNTLLSAGSAYIIERDGNGNWNQVQKLTASDRAAADLFGAAVSISGNYAIVGAYQEDDDPSGSNTLNNAGSAYIFERDGNGQWNQVQKIVSSDRAVSDRFGISVSINGTYAIAGAYLEDEDTQGGNFKSAAGSAYIFERDGNGNWNQVQKITAPDRDPNDYFGQAVYISGDYALAGAQHEATDNNGQNPFTSPGAAYLFKRSGNSWGLLQKITAPDRAASDYFGSYLTMENNYVVIGAHLEDDDTLGNNPLNASGSAYIYKLCSATTSTLNINTCSHYSAPSGRYTWFTTGTYTDTILNNSGCDSILTIHLTIKNTTAAVTATVCSSYTSPSGNHIWDQTGTYTDTIPNMQSCDSIITIQLTVNSNDTVLNIFECNSYTSPDGQQIWTSTGTYSDTLINSKACDSIILIHLNIGTSTSVTNVSACNSYTSPSGKYIWTSAGSYLDTIPNTKGCDSVMTIHLTIGNVSTNATTNKTVCYSYTSPSGNYTWNTNGTYMDTIPNMQGCDSIITIHLFVTNATTDTTIHQNACNSYASPSGKYTWTSTGTYADTIPNSQGCDSLITIMLTINEIDTDIAQNGNILIANTTGSTYQWLDCNNGYIAVGNETNHQYAAIADGSYAVAITENGCTDTSACYTVIISGIINELKTEQLYIYPNPAKNVVYINFSGITNEDVLLELTNSKGQVVYSKKLNGTRIMTYKQSIGISDLPNGLYLVSLKNAHSCFQSKLLITSNN